METNELTENGGQKQYDQLGFIRGVRSRNTGVPYEQNPYSGGVGGYSESWQMGWRAADMYAKTGLCQEGVGVGESRMYLVWSIGVMCSAICINVATNCLGWDCRMVALSLCVVGTICGFIGIMKGRQKDE